VVPENIHTPTTEGIGNCGGEGGQRPRKFQREGGWMIDLVSRRPSIQYAF